jgi:hypothetical protein
MKTCGSQRLCTLLKYCCRPISWALMLHIMSLLAEYCNCAIFITFKLCAFFLPAVCLSTEDHSSSPYNNTMQCLHISLRYANKLQSYKINSNKTPALHLKQIPTAFEVIKRNLADARRTEHEKDATRNL